MKVFAITLAAGVQAGIISQHETLNANYDNLDAQHRYFGGDYAASPAYPNVPNLAAATTHFDPHGTLFGEHRYQLQVAKTGNMLIGTEALRESISHLKDRLQYAKSYIAPNNDAISWNADSDQVV